MKIGDLSIGSDQPVAVQTMWDRPIDDVREVIPVLKELRAFGCDLIRFSVLDEQALQPLGAICEEKIMPVVADIHFDYRLAIGSLKAGADKIRINPGNIGAPWKVHEIISCAQDHAAAIRIGINGGSLPHSMRGGDHAQSMISLAGDYIQDFERQGFSDIVISLKDSDPLVCYEVNSSYAQHFSYPLHLGVTEAGPLIPAVTKSAFSLGRLLYEGIGDTVRISITGSIFDEVYAGKELLKSVGRYPAGVRIISCPKCGRAGFDTHAFTEEISSDLQRITAPVSVAVMGCAVNGPGEASRADLGITGLGNTVVLFKEGEIVSRVDRTSAREAFFALLEEVIDEKYNH